MKFQRAKRKRTSYKSFDHWIKAVYLRNKELIEEKLPDTTAIIEKRKRGRPATANPKFQLFKQSVIEHIQEGYRPEKALTKFAHTTFFTSYSEIFKENLLSGMRKEGIMKEFRELTKEKGRYTKLDPSKLVYKDGKYIYDNRISISISPKDLYGTQQKFTFGVIDGQSN